MSGAIYKGVLIEQSVSDATKILPYAKVVDERTAELESESFRGNMKLINIEVAKEQLWQVLQGVAETIQAPGWYFHLVGEGRIYVVMPKAIFFADGADDEVFTSIIGYASTNCGIHRDQLNLPGLFSDPYA